MLKYEVYIKIEHKKVVYVLIKTETLRVIQDAIIISILKLFLMIAYNDGRQIRFRLQKTLHGRRWDTTIFNLRLQRVPQTSYHIVFAVTVKKYLSRAQLTKLNHTQDIVEFQIDSTKSVKIVVFQVVHHTTGSYIIECLSIQQRKYNVRLQIQ